jgi:hypothetical protein
MGSCVVDDERDEQAAKTIVDNRKIKVNSFFIFKFLYLISITSGSLAN